MNILYFQGIVKLSTIFIFCFVLIYSFFFLEKTWNKERKKTWIYLSIASFLFLLYLVFSYFEIFNRIYWTGIKELFEFSFAGLLLLAFACQHYNVVVLEKKSTKQKRKSYK